jgi:hypothetical protein
LVLQCKTKKKKQNSLIFKYGWEEHKIP